MRLAFYFIFAAIAAIVLLTIFTGHDEPKPAERFKPKDDRFVEIVTETVKPNLMGNFKKQNITIPKDITVKDIDRVITIYPKDSASKEEPKKIDIIIDRKGQVFVENKLIDSVKVRKYEEAIFGFKQEIGAGVSYSARGRVDPSISYSFFHAKKLKIPVIETGIRSFGIGIQYPITGRLNGGVFYATEFKNLRTHYIKATVTLNF